MKRKKIVRIILLLVASVLLFTGVEFIVNMQINPIPDLPQAALSGEGLESMLYTFSHLVDRGLPQPAEQRVNDALAPSLTYIDARYDCSDFRVCELLHFYLTYKDQLADSTKVNIEKTLTGFKYWMDQGGSDSMCYWSENHQILFAVNEYLAGSEWPEKTFAVDGKSGRQHAEMAKNRINAWMQQRFLYGFTEFYSNNYYPEDIGAMSNFIRFAQDDEMAGRMKMIMDLIWFDMASQSHKYVSDSGRTYYIFLSASGRMYGDNKASDDTGNRLRSYIDFVVQPSAATEWKNNRNGFFNCFRLLVESGRYQVPDVIKAIFDDTSTQEIKSSQSLDVNELADEGLIGLNDDQIMMQWNMESFTNKEVIANTLQYISKHRMFSNMFLNDFKMINMSLIKYTGLAKLMSIWLNPATNGVAIQRGNVYTYKTAQYVMSTAQAYHPGDYGDQQHISTANLSNDLSIFVNQPARVPSRSSTPSYWVGNGRNPYAVQDKNVSISIYDVPQKPGFMEPHVVSFTHAYFPVQLFDETDESHLANGYVFGRKGDVYIALIANGSLAFEEYIPTDLEQKKLASKINGNLTEKYDLVHKEGRFHIWITELSSKNEPDPDFQAFKDRILQNPVTFNGNSVEYHSDGRILKSEYARQFAVDGVQANFDYERYENAYVPGGVVMRKPEEIQIQYAGKQLQLDYEKNIRKE